MEPEKVKMRAKVGFGNVESDASPGNGLGSIQRFRMTMKAKVTNSEHP